MHEFSLVQKILRMCLNAAARNRANKIAEIQLELGDFSLVVEKLMDQAFRIATKGTIAEGAKISMVRTPGKVLCQECGKSSTVWFENAQKSGNTEQKEKLKNYEENLTAQGAMSGIPGFGKNLFHCQQCGSKNTDLVEGKKILVKNIRIL